jgi:hypothetical protein
MIAQNIQAEEMRECEKADMSAKSHNFNREQKRTWRCAPGIPMTSDAVDAVEEENYGPKKD